AIAAALPGRAVQVEGEVLHSEVLLRPRRQLVATISDGTGRLWLRWLHFYPNQRRQVETGNRIRVRGEVRQGFNGPEIVHPRVSKAGEALPDALTPVYPTTEGLSQAVLRKRIQQALSEADLSESLPESLCRRLALLPFAEAIRLLPGPGPGRLPRKTPSCSTGFAQACRLRSPRRRSGSFGKLPPTWRVPSRCTACCKATWVAARRWSRPLPPPRRWPADTRWPSWRQQRF